jgi:acyl carrier protein
MSEEEIYKTLTETFQEVFDDDDIVPHADMVADDVDGWDSLTHIMLIVATEKEFGIKFTTQEIGDFKNVGSLVSLIKKRLEP